MAKNFLMIAAAFFFIIAGLMFVGHGFGFFRGFGRGGYDRGYGYYDNAYRGGHGGCGGYYGY